MKITNSTKMTSTAGAMWTRKSLKVRPARLPMMMLGGSPISVAAPPMFDASTSAIRNGCAAMSRRSQTTKVTGATNMMMVTLSSTGDATPVITISITMSRKGLPLDRFAAQMARKSNRPVCLITPTITIMPSSKKMTFQSMPSCSE